MYEPDQLADIIHEVRIWFEDGLQNIQKDIGDWHAPNFPYTINEMLWHIAESDWFTREHIIDGNVTAKYPPYSPDKDFNYWKGEYLAQNQMLENRIRQLSREEVNAEIEFPGVDGAGRDHPVMPLWRQVLRINFHTVSHIGTCRILRGLKGRLSGEKQNWPPY